jgi:hypothetical protein
VKDVTVAEGKDAVFNCKARSATGELPPNPPEWYKNAEPMASKYGRLNMNIFNK